MVEQHQLTELAELARIGEQCAAPSPPSQVRARGAQRRHRRHAVIAAAVTVLAVATGGAVLSATGLNLDERPDPPVASRISAAPSPTAGSPTARTLDQTHLLATQDIPLGANYDSLVVTDPEDGRQPAELSACQDGSAADLGARQALARNFRQDRADSPAGREPELYTLTLQFDDAVAVTAAQQTYTGWLQSCAARLEDKGYRALGGGAGGTRDPITIDAGSARGEAHELIYLEPGETEENGTFETVGLLPVEDRLVIMVRVVRGMDDNTYFWGRTPVEGLQKHPFYAMMSAAANKLA